MTNKDKQYNSADEKDVAAATRNDNNDKEAEIKAIHATMSTTSGRKTIWDLLARCGVFQGGFNPDAHATYFNNGKRDIGLYYMGVLVTTCHEQYLLMHKEQKLRELKRGDKK